MYVRIVTFHLDGVTPEQYERHCEQIASAFLDWSGLVAKVWLSDTDTNTFGGVYVFDSKEPPTVPGRRTSSSGWATTRALPM